MENGEKRVILKYNEFKEMLEKNNTREACKYFESLWDAYTVYMPISLTLTNENADKIYHDGQKWVDETFSNLLTQARKNGVASYRPKLTDFPQSGFVFGQLEARCEQMLIKSIYDFFHWARICTELPFQIINATFLGDEKVISESPKLICKVSEMLKKCPQYKELSKMIDNAKNDKEYKYLCAVDNQMKHIALVHMQVVAVQINFGTPPSNATLQFLIKEFSYKGCQYNEKDALKKTAVVYQFVNEFVYETLKEIKRILETTPTSSLA